MALENAPTFAAAQRRVSSPVAFLAFLLRWPGEVSHPAGNGLKSLERQVAPQKGEPLAPRTAAERPARSGNLCKRTHAQVRVSPAWRPRRGVEPCELRGASRLQPSKISTGQKGLAASLWPRGGDWKPLRSPLRCATSCQTGAGVALRAACTELPTLPGQVARPSERKFSGYNFELKSEARRVLEAI